MLTKSVKMKTKKVETSKCPFYDEFDKLLPDRDVVNLPEFMQVGSAKSQCNYVNVKDAEYPNVIKEVSIASKICLEIVILKPKWH